MWIVSTILPKKALETCNCPEYVLCLQKNVKYDKNQKLIYFFLWKTRVEASKVITNSLKTLNFVTTITFDTFPWNVLCDFSSKKLGNN